jgi:outer membrane protein
MAGYLCSLTMHDMISRFYFLLSASVLFILVGCAPHDTPTTESNSGLKIAYVNGDSILMNFEEFRTQSEAMEQKQRKAEEDLQKKGAALEREFMTYQQQAQKGTLTGKEMEAREKYLSGKQEALLMERDRLAKEIMDETSVINERLQKVLQDRLKEIKDKEGYDFILSYIAGGPILVADEKYDITNQVLEELNKSTPSAPADTTATQ